MDASLLHVLHLTLDGRSLDTENETFGEIPRIPNVVSPRKCLKRAWIANRIANIGVLKGNNKDCAFVYIIKEKIDLNYLDHIMRSSKYELIQLMI